MNHQEDKDDRHGTVIGGLIVLGLGVIFLLSNLDIVPDFGTMWPLVLVVIGIALLVGAVVKREGKKEEDRIKSPEEDKGGA